MGIKTEMTVIDVKLNYTSTSLLCSKPKLNSPTPSSADRQKHFIFTDWGTLWSIGPQNEKWCQYHLNNPNKKFNDYEKSQMNKTMKRAW